MLFFVLFLADSVVDLYVILSLSKTYVWTAGRSKRLRYIKLFVVAHNIHSAVADLVKLGNFAFTNVSTLNSQQKKQHHVLHFSSHHYFRKLPPP